MTMEFFRNWLANFSFLASASIYILPLFFGGFLYVWQNVKISHLNRELNALTRQKEELIRSNDDLKIGITSYTSAKRIEALYRKTYQYLPVTVGNRIETIVLPPEKKHADQ